MDDSLLDEFDRHVPNGPLARFKQSSIRPREKCSAPTRSGKPCRGRHLSVYDGKPMCNAHIAQRKRGR